MNKSILKLMTLLKNFYNDMMYELKSNFAEVLTDKDSPRMASSLFAGVFGTWLTLEPELAKDHKIIFSEFEILSTFLDANEFSQRDKFNIVSNVIDKNIKNSLLDDEVAIDPFDELSEDFMSTLFDIDNIMSYGKDDSYFESFIRMEKSRIEHTEANPNIKRGLLNKSLTNYRTLQNSHNTFKTSYLDKKDSYTHDDVLCIFTALLDIGVSFKTTKDITDFLETKLKKREANKPIEITPTEQKVVEPPKSINQRQIKKTFKELETYFNFFNMEPIRTLSYDEIIFCLAKIKQTDCSVELMQNFITKIDKYNEQNDSLVHAEVILRRLQAYKDTFEEPNSDYTDVVRMIEVLEGYLNEIRITELEEEKEIWKESIVEEIPYALTLLPSSHTL